MKRIRQARAWPPAARTAIAIMAIGSLTLLAAACASPSSTNSSGSSNAGGSANSQAVSYSRCVRSHGVPNFPDPPSSGKFVIPSAQQLGVSNSQLQAAENACQHLRQDNGGGEPSQALLQRNWSEMRRIAQCMRSHGMPNWPDPTRYPPEPDRPAFDVRSLGIDPNSPQIDAKIQHCMSLQGIHGQPGSDERFVGS